MTVDTKTAKESAEAKLCFCIPEDVADDVLDYAKRKCEVGGKPGSYLPLLYENELLDYFVRKALNGIGETG